MGDLERYTLVVIVLVIIIARGVPTVGVASASKDPPLHAYDVTPARVPQRGTNDPGGQVQPAPDLEPAITIAPELDHLAGRRTGVPGETMCDPSVPRGDPVVVADNRKSVPLVDPVVAGGVTDVDAYVGRSHGGADSDVRVGVGCHPGPGNDGQGRNSQQA